MILAGRRFNVLEAETGEDVTREILDKIPGLNSPLRRPKRESRVPCSPVGAITKQLTWPLRSRWRCALWSALVMVAVLQRLTPLATHGDARASWPWPASTQEVQVSATARSR